MCFDCLWSDVWRFCKNDSDTSLQLFFVTRVESFGKNRDSIRVESRKVVTRVESLTRVTLSLLTEIRFWMAISAQIVMQKPDHVQLFKFQTNRWISSSGDYILLSAGGKCYETTWVAKTTAFNFLLVQFFGFRSKVLSFWITFNGSTCPVGSTEDVSSLVVVGWFCEQSDQLVT